MIRIPRLTSCELEILWPVESEEIEVKDCTSEDVHLTLLAIL